eukprot:2095755-Rhodomonas_salina.1
MPCAVLPLATQFPALGLRELLRRVGCAVRGTDSACVGRSQGHLECDVQARVCYGTALRRLMPGAAFSFLIALFPHG